MGIKINSNISGFVTVRKMQSQITKYRIYDLEHEDLERIIEIENESFITPWPREIFEMEFKLKRSYNKVCRDEQGVVTGYCLSWLIHDEIHILKVAVASKFRKKGIAGMLITDTLEHFRSIGANHAVLEVRTDNTSAISLYEKLGFEPVRIRRNYYRETGDDALVMMLEF